MPLATGARPAGGARVDYKEILNEEDFRLFAQLRELRKQVAEEMSVPLFAIFSNEQLAEIARQSVDSVDRLNSSTEWGKEGAEFRRPLCGAGSATRPASLGKPAGTNRAGPLAQVLVRGITVCRVGELWRQIVSWENFVLAAHKAAPGKRRASPRASLSPTSIGT